MTWIHSSRFAKKVRNAGGVERITPDAPEHVCPTCNKPIDNDNELAPQDWTGLPAGVKFDPNDKEILDHLAAKIGRGGKPHALIDEFIPTLEDDEGICSKHPEKLPGVKSDGSSSHFFHRPSNAYTKGTRKRRKVQTDDDDETRWHKTGKTRPVMENGEVIGWKKIMVLYTNFKKKSKPKKTNWVIHQYHVGIHEDEREGELVMSKVFFQTQPRGSVREPCEANEAAEANEGAEVAEANDSNDVNEASFSRELEAALACEPENDESAKVARTCSTSTPEVVKPCSTSTAEVVWPCSTSTPEVLRPCSTSTPEVVWPCSTSTPEVVRPCPSRPVPQLAEMCPTIDGYYGASTSGMSLVRCPTAQQPLPQTPAERVIEELLCDESFNNVATEFENLSSQEIRAFTEVAGISCEEEDILNFSNEMDFSLGVAPEITSQEVADWFKSQSQEQGLEQDYRAPF
ncbi:NAC domain-containing protein 82 isoform X2 [Selaginella moellendorffii]|uniref:NAC domain-containing protein 82 isoform X2 n=1 Tax=Selaginella moellendorffii TaxID=88036 RepID=UPI000D1C7564|nr:NAC domain-containing protein 82 isoform X2 [Selaginella moellendorffii]|eukprot:XP_002975901.2 NAC domain-containing protein 82 isoform X2 [Selaginella moellendorffii]